jgi:hypothetical protein
MPSRVMPASAARRAGSAAAGMGGMRAACALDLARAVRTRAAASGGNALREVANARLDMSRPHTNLKNRMGPALYGDPHSEHTKNR